MGGRPGCRWRRLLRRQPPALANDSDPGGSSLRAVASLPHAGRAGGRVAACSGRWTSRRRPGRGERRPVDRGLVRARLLCWSTGGSGSMTQHLSTSCPGCLVVLAVARTATASSMPRAAVAVSGIAFGAWKPDAAACGADMAPISSAVHPAQRRPARQPRAVCTLSAAAASPAATSAAACAGCRAGITARQHRVRSSTAAASSMTAIRRPPGRMSDALVVISRLRRRRQRRRRPGACSSARDRVVLLQLLA
jgi:hypothetical protein